MLSVWRVRIDPQAAPWPTPSTSRADETIEVVDRGDAPLDRFEPTSPSSSAPRPLVFDARALTPRQLEAVLALALAEGGVVEVGGEDLGPTLGTTPLHSVTRVEDGLVHLDGLAAPLPVADVLRIMHRVTIDGAPEAEQAARDHLAQAEYEDTYGGLERNVWQPLVQGWHGLRSRWYDWRARGQARVLDILERIEAGEGVPRRLETVPGEIAGYQRMDPERRAKLLARLRESVPENIAMAARADEAAAEVPHSPLLDRLARTESMSEAYEVLTEDGFDTAQVAALVLFSSVARQPDVFAAGALGAWVAGPWGARIAAGAASFGGEYGVALRESLRIHGVDVTDPEAVVAAWRDPELMASVEFFAERRASAVAVFSTIGYGSPFGRSVGGQAANLAFQSGVDASGEAVAQLWSTGEITSPAEIYLEGLGGLVTAPIEVATTAFESANLLPTPELGPRFADPLPYHVLSNPTPGTLGDAEIHAANLAVREGRLGAPAPLEEALIQRLPGWETLDTNATYGQAAAAIVTELRQGVAVGGIQSFREALDFVSPRINQVARDLKREDVWDYAEFGRPRTLRSETPMSGKYEAYRAASVEALEHFADGEWRIEEDGVRLTTHVPPLVFRDNEARAPRWEHTPPASFPAIHDAVERAWTDARHADDPAALVEAVANLHWWGAHMAPFDRSSAASIDIIAKALLIEGGIQPGRWREGVGVDLEAFFQSREAFVDAYASYHAP